MPASIADQAHPAPARTDLERGPRSHPVLAACHAAGCSHAECASAAAALDYVARRTGTARRLQGLAAMGHSTAALGARLDLSRVWLHHLQHGRVAWVPEDTARAVAALYTDLWDVPGGSPRSARAAAANGWVLPVCWDERPGDLHWIDDPSARPVGRRRDWLDCVMPRIRAAAAGQRQPACRARIRTAIAAGGAA
jgi:hypothetical protein